MTSQTEPVLVTGDVHVKSMPKQAKYYATQPRTFVLRLSDTQPQLIRPRTRNECHTVIVAMSTPNAAAASQASTVVEGSVTSPGASATIANAGTFPAGTYQIGWAVSLSGTVSATDVNNFQLRAGAPVALASINPGAVGSYPQTPVTVTFTAPTQISVVAIGAGTVGAVYAAQIVVTPVVVASAPASGWISDNEADCDRQAGALVQSNMAGPIELEGNTELWAMIDPGSSGSLYLSVFVEIDSS